MPLFQTILFFVFATVFVTAIWAIASIDNASSALAQMAASVSLEGLLLVILFSFLEKTREQRVLSTIQHAFKRSAVGTLEILTLFWLDADAGHDLAQRVSLALPQLRRHHEYTRALMPAVAAIDAAHLQAWWHLSELLGRICAADPDELQSLSAEFRHALNAFRAL